MSLGESDFLKIREIVQEIVDESQERLARMIVKELLDIRDELSKIRQGKPELRLEISEVKLDQEVLKVRIQNIELGMVEHRKDSSLVTDRLGSVERELNAIRGMLKGTATG